MLELDHRHKRHPDAGELRIWSVRANDPIAVRTVGRVMALNQHVDDDSPPVSAHQAKKPPGPHPDKATHAPQSWGIDGRRMDFALDGVNWWRLLIRDGYSRTLLAGAMAPSEASWAALRVRYTAGLRSGAPQALISDRGGASLAHEFEAVGMRLQMAHQTLISTQGESYLNLMATHFNIQRRVYDYQFSLSHTPGELEQAHQACLQRYPTTAHQGLLTEGFAPPLPLAVLAAAKGRMLSPDELAQQCSRALVPRMTHRYGCVTLHRYHFSVEAGLPKTQGLLWVSGEQRRARFDHVVFAAYHCRDDWHDRHLKEVRDGVFYATPFASPQGSLIPVHAQESLGL